MKFRSALLTVCLAAAPLACAPRAPEPEPRGDGISLVLLVAVDQARADYLDRFRPLFTSGLARLLDGGAVFTDAHHEHSMTATAPGHAALSTGAEPARSGIVGNEWRDRETGLSVYAAGSSASRSPVYLEVTALGDWMKERDPRSKVFTASGKDRSAVMLGGQRPDGAYWYDRSSGAWTTSSYYAGAERAWLDELNDRRWLDTAFGTLWVPLAGYPAVDEYGIRRINAGPYQVSGAHALGGLDLEPGPSFYGDIYDSPFLDGYLAQLARTILVEEELGMDGSPDLLAISFSALDTVGHDYGPDSPEVLDVLLRLDTLLGDLFDLVDERVGAEHVLAGLSSDHGVQRLPELDMDEALAARRMLDDDIACVQAAGRELQAHVGGSGWSLSSWGGLYLDDDALTALGADPERIEALAVELLESCAAIRKVWTAAELTSDWNDDPDWERFRRNYFPVRSPDLSLQYEPFHLMESGTGTTHGSPYDYDSHVPFILYGPGVGPVRIDERVATVDMAPTLARLLGIEPPASIDGEDRSPLLQPTWN